MQGLSLRGLQDEVLRFQSLTPHRQRGEVVAAVLPVLVVVAVALAVVTAVVKRWEGRPESKKRTELQCHRPLHLEFTNSNTPEYYILKSKPETLAARILYDEGYKQGQAKNPNPNIEALRDYNKVFLQDMQEPTSNILTRTPKPYTLKPTP